MSGDNPTPSGQQPSLLRNWLSLTGLVIVIGSGFSFFMLLLLDAMATFSNPYVGILTYIVTPGFTMMGLVLTIIGALRERRQLHGTRGLMPMVVIDLTRPRDRRVLGFFIGGSLIFLLLSAMGSYHTYHFTESVQFCGQTCHTVMQPELVTYQHGPHARVSCTECHIGPGATWFVKAKISGTYQLYATAFDKYPRPIPTPIKNLRPAQETCEQCHWPKKFVGNLERTYNYFLGDETNTPFSLSLLMKVGGADPTHGPEGGIHWHMNVKNKVEYIATDAARQKIPWVRIVDPQGVVTEFRTRGFTNDPASFTIRAMDRMDCHNRPAHKYQTPDDAVNLAISLGHFDRTLPWIKTNAVYALTRDYKTETEALQGIATHLAEHYPNEPRIRPVIDVVQQLYRDNFFPEMKASWKIYPDYIGHKNWPGCFRCHDGKHKSEDGQRIIKANDCNACHNGGL
jgi:nitrate/TMAO reductase-like tetraheme cytochrome c subunit